MKTPLEVLKLYPQHDYTLAGLLQTRLDPDAARPCLLFNEKTVSWAEFVEAVGKTAGMLAARGIKRGDHAARFEGGKLGVLQGCKTYILQNPDGQIELTHSVSAGLDYAAIGPEHAFYRDRGRIDFAHACDDEVMEAFQLCSRLEGIIPALESTHALVHGLKRARDLRPDQVIIINLSGRGDKDVNQVAKILGVKL